MIDNNTIVKFFLDSKKGSFVEAITCLIKHDCCVFYLIDVNKFKYKNKL